MAADQTKNKNPLGKSNGNNRDSDKRHMGKPGNRADNDPSSGQPHQGYNEEKTNRIDYSQQIGEFSHWGRRS
jgi:hypothetical protein